MNNQWISELSSIDIELKSI